MRAILQLELTCFRNGQLFLKMLVSLFQFIEKFHQNENNKIEFFLDLFIFYNS
ncbi:hypothetical protein DB44_DE00190 [Candidatus Protochlamydia amoebophila]|uniref:Uncharacterized protein n=1 Tax=Candidatus Protochlamydia amoebophila TaxID=362787 RepID=A0A0C1HA28_9BACT|nr:hypothetical protein DB44_DE00190 [Candidatus Protochlamydia amoebophila]